MKTLKNEWPVWLALLAPLALIAVYWNEFPDRMPVHFNAKGQPDGYAGKWFGLLFLPAVNLAMYFLMRFIPRIDPSKNNFALFEDKYRIMRVVIHAFMSFIFFVISFYALGYAIDITRVILYSTMVMFLIFGNYLGTIRHNYFVGIRTPWTLSDEDIWTKTHRLTGRVWVIGTLIMLIVFTLLPKMITLFFIYVTVIVIIPVVYSYLLFKKKSQHQQG